MTDYRKQVREIEKILCSVSRKKIRNSYALAVGIYFKLRLKISFRTLPVHTGWKNYHWSNFRYWFQKLQKLGKIEEIRKIVEVKTDESFAIE